MAITGLSVGDRLGRMGTLAGACAIFLAAVLPASANPRLVIDVDTLKVYEHQDIFQKWYPASLTKLMTAYITFRAIKADQLTLESPVVMTKNAASEPPSKMFYKPGQKMTLDSALKMMLVKSANDVAVAIAETVGGTEQAFIERMNAEARRIGMTSSRFINPHGLPGEGQYTTARDLAVLAVTLKREFPQYASYFALEGFTTGKKDYPNYNMLIGRFEGADGMKTGFICASGFNQVSSAVRSGRRVVSVVLGEDSLGARADESARLLQKALTTVATDKPSLAEIPPYGESREVVADVSREICSKQAAKVRSEGRDEAGRQKLLSPYIHEIDRPLKLAFAGLMPGSNDKIAKAGKNATAQGDAVEIADVPIPVPRPSF
ncbi:penicillin-binding protein [Sinorhizobium medicae]|uniref:Serine-type D-Ala-D-Ala carboxypeptidase n=5 Tax=Sinorhizobium medicae TaxID=110321 RepID=A6UCM2_SINMW|nr:Serine-type D-Ala-D-Ala carboxypeptidase [Sinorhizobium medicae WSM419]PLT93236.1 penicillin-binding protein [Sinorhizobium medicae]PLT96192.1 penicillin-binding protein [Sinorhizobium medicae]PLU00561.1 penicillin-binding protein [Sinorhizobium medicae]PLU14229.1 penicillin-binding protein [Sinorhizobium medicae]